jgi:hypothetical protein
MTFRPKFVYIFVSILLLLPAVGNAQVSPDRIAQIAQAVHDAERWSLGASSTRQTRNEFWSRIIGIVHFGHPVYNSTPDPSWCLKDGGGGRPQTDDVATKCATREFWDCIGGVGADGYRFGCSGHGAERLPAVQNVYPPPRPAGGGVSSGGGGSTPPAPPAPAPVPDLTPILAQLDALAAQVSALTAKLDTLAGVLVETRDAAIRGAEDARALAARPVPVLSVPCLTGRVPKAFGGSSVVTFCPEAP